MSDYDYSTGNRKSKRDKKAKAKYNKYKKGGKYRATEIKAWKQKQFQNLLKTLNQ